MLLDLLLQAQAMGPESCSLTGLCQPPAAGPRLSSGVMFTAIGLVGLGVWNWRRGRAGRLSRPEARSSVEPLP